MIVRGLAGRKGPDPCNGSVAPALQNTTASGACQSIPLPVLNTSRIYLVFAVLVHALPPLSLFAKIPVVVSDIRPQIKSSFATAQAFCAIRERVDISPA